MPASSSRRGLHGLRAVAELKHNSFNNLYFLRSSNLQAARCSSASTTSSNSCVSVACSTHARISSRSAARRNALHLSACEGRRYSSSHRLALRSTSSPAGPPHDDTSTPLSIHPLMLKQPTLAHTFRTCCCPAPRTSLRSLDVVSMAPRSAAASRVSAAL